MNQKHLLKWVIPVIIFCTSCDPFDNNRRNEPPAETTGWAPIYGEEQAIQSGAPRPIEKEGKIYKKGNMLYQIENGKGIHMIDISNPSSPVKKHFVAVTGAQEMAIKNNYLYTNNINDLVVLDISNPDNVQVVDRVSNVFKIVDQFSPPGVGWYECPDASKGVVIGWEQKTIYKPKCIK